MTKSLPIRIENRNHELYVYWLITDWCNQQCSYFPSILNQGDFHKGRRPGFPSREQLLKFCDTLNHHHEASGRRLRVTLTGGEPTIHPDFADILAKLKPLGWVEVITNGTRSSTWWQTLAQLPDRVVISLHPEYYDRRVERINDLTRFLVSRGVVVVYNLIALPDKWHMVQRMHQDLDPEYRPWVIPKLVQDLTDLQARPRVAYTAEQLAWIKEYPTRVASVLANTSMVYREDLSQEPTRPYQLMADNQHRFRGWYCAAGVSSINVDYEGRVAAGICTSEMLGTIDSFQLRDQYLRCHKSECTCPGDIIVDKYRWDQLNT